MAKRELERTVQQSVLDRLIDLDRHASVDPSTTRAASVRALKLAVRRDLEWLLNTRRIAELAPDSLPELNASVYHYGVPDISSLSKDSDADRARLLREIESAVALYEPRITDVRVTVTEVGDEGRRQIHFAIEGMLQMDPTPEQVMFDTTLELSSGSYELKDDAGA